MRLPNFFLVGAPKCGTTALCEYLRGHPQIFMCAPKEPHYFAVDLPQYRIVTSVEAYGHLFAGALEHHRAIGEASVFYMYSNAAIQRIRNLLPDSMLLVMLRNPAELAVSMHAQALISRDENIVDFDQAWRLCRKRRAGKNIPSKCRDVKILLYDEIPLLGQQLKSLLSIFPRGQVRWWFYDDFRANPQGVYKEVLNFLDVCDDGRDKFPFVNVRKRARSQVLAQFTQKPPERLLRSTKWLKQIMGIKRLGVMERLRRVNFAAAPSQVQLSPGLIDDMRKTFAADVNVLSELTQRDLSHWLRSQA